jgi:hypothetical protein
MTVAVQWSQCTPGRHTRGIGVVAPLFPILVGRDRSVGIATRYGLDGTGIESRWGGGEVLYTRLYTDPGAHPASCTMGAGSLSRG